MFIRRDGFLLSDWVEDDWFVQLRELAVFTSVSSPMGDTVREALVSVCVFFCAAFSSKKSESPQ